MFYILSHIFQIISNNVNAERQGTEETEERNRQSQYSEGQTTLKGGRKTTKL
jgi:hypothetical protein